MASGRILRDSFPDWLISLIPAISVALAYILFSRLGYFLVIPPGSTSVMWPPVGVALGFVYVFGARAVPGVFIGCFVTIFSRYDTAGNTEILIALFLSVGATLHAWVGSKLIKLFSKTEFYSASLRGILIFLFIGGPVACILTSVIGGLTITYFNNLPFAAFWDIAGTWWIGDVFGVIVFAPLTTIALSWSIAGRNFAISSVLTMVLPLVVSITAFAFLFDSARKELSAHAFDQYFGEVNNVVNQFTETLSVNVAIVKATASFIEASETVTAAQFNIFTNDLFNASAGLYGLSWLPKVTHDQRQSFVEGIRQQNFPDFVIKSRNEQGQLVISERRDIYYPLAYTEPYEQNKPAHGFDVYGQDGVSGDVRRSILDKARDLREPRATNRFSIVQKQDEYGFIIYHPVYKARSADTDREHIGYINGIFVFPDLMGGVIKKLKASNSDFILMEKHENGDERLLFDARTPDNKEGEPDTYKMFDQVYTEHEFNVAGQTWKITFLKNEPLLVGEYVRTLWVLAGGGAIFNMLFLLILMMVTSQNRLVQQQVDSRTLELKQANDELEEFAYRTSHDLRSPIISSTALLDLANESLKSGNSDVAMGSISHASDSLKKLDVLINDILKLTRVGSENEDGVLLNISEIVKEAIAKLDHSDGFKNLTVQIDVSGDIEVFTKPSRLKLILENLISNAVKYQDPDEENPQLGIACAVKIDHIEIKVFDNGLGIPEEYRGQVFGMFKRFHPKVAYGSGLGLYMMKRSALILGGDIFYEPLEKGTLFRLLVPLNDTQAS